MSTWNLGADHDSDQVFNLKQQLASKENQYITLQSQVLKRSAEYEELRQQLNDTINKLRLESDKALDLDSQLQKQTSELHREILQRQNVEHSLAQANDKIKAQERDHTELEITLQRLSNNADGSRADCLKLTTEKTKLEARIRELQANLDQLVANPPAPPQSRLPRPRSSSLSGYRVTSLEQLLNEAREALARKDTEVQAAQERLSQVLHELTRTQNGKMASEKAMHAREAALEAAIEEKNEEIDYLQQELNEGARTREAELLDRIDEEETKCRALEKAIEQMTREASRRSRADSGKMEEQLKRTQARLEAQFDKVKELEEHAEDLERERDDPNVEAQSARREIRRLNDSLREHNRRIVDLEQQLEEARTVAASNATIGDVTMRGSAFAEGMLPPDAAGDAFHSTPVPNSRSLPVIREPEPQRSAEAQAVAEVQRLTVAAQRLRGERDALRRDLEFVEMEAKFRIEALEKQKALDQLPLPMLHRFKTATSVLSLVVAHLQSHRYPPIESGNILESALAEATKLADDRVHMLETTQTALRRAEEQSQQLADELVGVQVQKDGLLLYITQLQSKTNESADMLTQARTEHEETKLSLAQAESVIQALQDVESERDSLNLQVANLQSDLETAQAALATVEARYSAQLARGPMSTHEATRALREHIEELEGRVERRTEQIGQHQHDIRRLETNLRLQEERVEEMTAELDEARAEKEAMIEDCAEARAARDEALCRIEEVETETEILERRVESAEEERASQAAVLVGLMANAITRSRTEMRALQTRLASSVRTRDDLSLRLSAAEEQGSRAVANLHASGVQHDDTRRMLEDISVAMETAIATSAAERHQFGIALAVAFRDGGALVKALRTANHKLQSGHEYLRREVRTSLTHQQGALDAARATTQMLQAKVDELERAKSDFEARYQQALDQHGGLQEEWNAVREQLAADATSLQEQLSLAQRDLAEASGRNAAAEAKIAELTRSNDSLQAEVAASASLSEKVAATEAELSRSQAEHAAELQDLQAKIGQARDDIDQLTAARQDIERNYQETTEELSRTRDDYEERLARAIERLNANAHLEKELSASRHELGALQEKDDRRAEEIEQLRVQLREADDKMVEDEQNHASVIQVLTERCNGAETEQRILEQRISDLNAQLSSANVALLAVREEKEVLRLEAAMLDGEIQRSIALHQTLKGKVEQSDHEIRTLREELGRVLGDLSLVQAAEQAAESQLAVEVAQHQQVVAALQDELTTLRNRPESSPLPQEVQDKLEDLEEMLRRKSKEVEENDEAWIAAERERKKLARLVDTLTRKVTKLEAKLAAAREALQTANPPQAPTAPPALAPTPVPAPVISGPSVAGLSQSTPVPPTVLPPTSPKLAARALSTSGVASSSTPNRPNTPNRTRTTSGGTPSSIPRPKTPEGRGLFRAKTPERAPVPPVPPLPMPTLPINGKKRPAPEDFDDCDHLPPQAFTADSAPSRHMENTTPGGRRLAAVRSGFTPVRNVHARAASMHTSPRRTTEPSATVPHKISDVTNSPRASVPMPSVLAAEKPVRKGWLNKMKSAQASSSHMRSATTAAFMTTTTQSRTTVSSRSMVFKKYGES